MDTTWDGHNAHSKGVAIHSMVLIDSCFIYPMDLWAVAMGHASHRIEETMGSSRKPMAWYKTFPWCCMDTTWDDHNAHSKGVATHSMVLTDSYFIYPMDPWAVARGHASQRVEETMAIRGKGSVIMGSRKEP